MKNRNIEKKFGSLNITEPNIEFPLGIIDRMVAWQMARDSYIKRGPQGTLRGSGTIRK